MQRRSGRRALGLGVAIALLWALPLHAQDDDESETEGEPAYDRTGFYGGFAVSYADDVSLGSIDKQTGNSVVIDGIFGMRFHSRVSAEIQAGWLEGFDDADSVPMTLNFKTYILTGRFQPFLKGGVGVQNANLPDENGRSWGGALRGGGGIDFYAERDVVLSFTTEYLAGTGNLNNADYVNFTFGFLHRW